MIILLLKPRKHQKHSPTKRFVNRFFFFFVSMALPHFLAIVARYYMSADFTSHDICLTSVKVPICGPVHRVQSNRIRQVRGSLLSSLGIKFQNLNLLHFDQIIGLKSLSIYLFLQAWLNLGLQIDRLPGQASLEALCSEKEREREREREREGERERRLLIWCQNLPVRHCYAGVHAVSAVSESTCQALCCRGAGCLSRVRTYLPGTVLQGCRLFKLCRNLHAGHCVAGVQAMHCVAGVQAV